MAASTLLLASSAFAAADLVITGTDGNDTLTGTAASESIYGRGGNDTINAGAGDDELDGGPGADVLSGGDGSDVVSYSGSAPVTVTLDGVANDGAAGEGDNVLPDIEDIYGGDGNDTLTGNDGANTIDGGAGDDHITGGTGADALFGGAGDDLIDAQDGQVDTIDCGDGNDTAAIDNNDIVANCEKVSKPAVTIRPQLTISNGKQKVMLVSSVVGGSRIVFACAKGCGKKYPPTKALVERNSVVLKQGFVSFKLLRQIKGATIELGVTAPGASTTCRVYKISKSYGGKVQQTACTTIAKGS